MQLDKLQELLLGKALLCRVAVYFDNANLKVDPLLRELLLARQQQFKTELKEELKKEKV